MIRIFILTFEYGIYITDVLPSAEMFEYWLTVPSFGKLIPPIDFFNVENLDDFGPRFPDMSKAYTPEYRDTAHKVADKLGIKLDDGVYIGVTGPTYETPAEIRAYKTLGADAVGMSTVPEVIVAAHSGLKVLGISCITNFAAGFQEELNHEEVVEVTERVKGDFKGLLKAILAEL